MNILFLCKRRPQNKDLLNRPYGRFYFLPYWLAKRGHTVTVMLLSYKRDDEPICIKKNGITWVSESFQPWDPLAYIKKADQYVSNQKPDWVIGFSDTYYGILAERLASKYNTKSCIDAYDNYESYLHWMKPLHWLWRRSLSKTHLVTAAGQELAELMRRDSSNQPMKVVPMAPDPEFIPLNKEKCREHFNLPSHKKIIGYSGGLHSNRGADFLYDIVESFQHRDDVIFVFSGRHFKNVKLHPSVKWLGYLTDNKISLLLNAFDILLVVNKPSSFGNYSYPIKLYEAMACQLPVVASDVSGSREILKNHTELLSKSLSIVDFSEIINIVLQLGKFDYQQESTWEASSKIFEEGLTS